MPGRSEWTWDETLFAGSARYYARGRMPYPHGLVVALRDELGLDGTGRLLDVGCGPGSLTHLLAPLFEEAVGIDADPEMVREAAAQAAPNARFVHLRAEDLPSGLGSFRLATLAQSFHWLDGERVARTLHAMLEPAGSLVHVGATTHEGDGNVPHEEIAALVRRWLGTVRRAGRGALPEGTRADERDVLESCGFRNRRAIDVARGEEIVRSEDDIVASVFSRSSSAPHLFGERVREFEAELRELLRGRGPFVERPRPVTALVWDS